LDDHSLQQSTRRQEDEQGSSYSHFYYDKACQWQIYIYIYINPALSAIDFMYASDLNGLSLNPSSVIYGSFPFQ
ncbi:hypothetical protein, partial [Enterobacter roggenkampii]|uniref:hypothetical protein n=1 Tax=Enterobacter roggenkampii TaxID=1812935 RepID=UPI002FE60054